MHYECQAIPWSAVAAAGLVACLVFECAARRADAGASEAGAAPERRPGDYPAATLSNRHVQVGVYLPDAAKGHYRGRRFDWSGHVARVRWKGHTFFGPFREADDPDDQDANALGTAGEFRGDAPPGYTEAAAGETFVKIGVGKLRKPDDAPYRYAADYEIVEPGTWAIDRGEDWISFSQTLLGDRGWRYAYGKRIDLLDDAPGFVITHLLRNIGTKRIETAHYSHNFIIIDDVPIGPAYRVELPFEIDGQIKHDDADVHGRTVVFRRALERPLFAGLKGGKDADDNHARVWNTHTGAGIAIDGDTAPTKYYLFAQATAVCPEPYVSVNLEPGESKTWTTTYTLFETEKEP